MSISDPEDMAIFDPMVDEVRGWRDFPAQYGIPIVPPHGEKPLGSYKLKENIKVFSDSSDLKIIDFAEDGRVPYARCKSIKKMTNFEHLDRFPNFHRDSLSKRRRSGIAFVERCHREATYPNNVSFYSQKKGRR